MQEEDLPPPPPAYSEMEFDRKVSTALEVSLSTPQPTAHGQAEEWEQWDEAAFQAASQRASGKRDSEYSSGSGQVHGSSSRAWPHRPPEGEAHGARSDNAVKPLQIHKKTPSSSSSNGMHSTKERPSWYAEAGLGGSSAPPGPEPSSSSQPPRRISRNGQSYASNPQTIEHSIPLDDDDDDRSLPPPPFAAVGPSLDGPPFEEVATLSYHGNQSSPPSPLNSPISPRRNPLPNGSPTSPTYPRPPAHVQQHYPSQYPHMQPPGPTINHHHNPVRQSLPSPPQMQSYQTPQTTGNAYSTPNKPMQTSTMAQLGFNHSMAYNRGGGRPEVSASQETPYINAAAFYNSAVSAHLPNGSKPIPMNQQPSMNIPKQQRPLSHYHTSQYSNPPTATYQQTSYQQFPDQQSQFSNYNGYSGSQNGSLNQNQNNWNTSPVAPTPTRPIQFSQTPLGNATQFPMNPTYSDPRTNNGVGPDRWATSEFQFTGGFNS